MGVRGVARRRAHGTDKSRLVEKVTVLWEEDDLVRPAVPVEARAWWLTLRINLQQPLNDLMVVLRRQVDAAQRAYRAEYNQHKRERRHAMAEDRDS